MSEPRPNGPHDQHDDPTTAAYFAAARDGRLLLQRCAVCEADQFYPRPHCIRCGGQALTEVVASGRGVVYSLTRVHLEVIPTRRPPYFVGLVTLEEGPRMMANLEEGDRYIGERVCLSWQYPPTGFPVPVFSPAASQSDTSRCVEADANNKELTL